MINASYESRRLLFVAKDVRALERPSRRQWSAPWLSLMISPAWGSAATTAMLVAFFVDLAFKRLRLRLFGVPLVYSLNLAGQTLDRALPFR